MNTKQLTWPSIEIQKQFWINKETVADNATNETREDITTFDKLAKGERFEFANKSNVGFGKYNAVFTKTAYDAYRGECFVGYPEPYVEVKRETLPQIPDGNASTTADPKPKDDLSRTESACEFYDDQEQRWSLRDAGRNPDGSGESYGERNV